MSRTLYPTDLTDTQWQLSERRVPKPKRGGRPARYSRREIVNALRYQRRNGLVQHDLGSPLVHGQGNAALDAVLVTVAASPLLRLRLDLLPRFRVGHEDCLLVQARHSCCPPR